MQMLRQFWISFSLLALAVIGLAAQSLSRPTVSYYSTAPLPSPGSATQLEFENDSEGPHKLSVEVPVKQSFKAEPFYRSASPLDCTISLAIVKDGQQVELSRSVLGFYGTMGSRNSALFGSSQFTLPKGRHDFELRNEGCKSGVAFPGGMAAINYAGPVRFNLPLLIAWRTLPYVLAVLGFSLLISVGRKAFGRKRVEST